MSINTELPKEKTLNMHLSNMITMFYNIIIVIIIAIRNIYVEFIWEEKKPVQT